MQGLVQAEEDLEQLEELEVYEAQARWGGDDNARDLRVMQEHLISQGASVGLKEEV